MLQCCADLWRLIADFLGSPLLSHVCLPIWTALQGRHLSYHAKLSAAPQLVCHFGRYAELHTLTIAFRKVYAGGVRSLGALKDAPALTTLALSFCCAGDEEGLGNDDAKALAALKDAPSLTALTLDLGYNFIGDDGACALSTLSHAPKLTALTLHLDDNQIGNTGARALAALMNTPGLTELGLFLDENVNIDYHGIVPLVALEADSPLKILDLDLSNVDFQSGGVGDELLALRHATNLTDLSLALQHHLLRDVRCATAMRESQSLTSLSLDLESNDLGYLGAWELAALRTAPCLRALGLSLWDNDIGNAGAEALAALKLVSFVSLLRLSLHPCLLSMRVMPPPPPLAAVPPPQLCCMQVTT